MMTARFATLPILRRIRAGLALIAIASTLALAACGGDDESSKDSTSPAEAKREAPAVTETTERTDKTSTANDQAETTTTDQDEPGAAQPGDGGQEGSSGKAAEPKPSKKCAVSQATGTELRIPPKPRLTVRRLDAKRVELTASYVELPDDCKPYRLRVTTPNSGGGGSSAKALAAKEYRLRGKRTRMVLRLAKSDRGKQTISAASVTKAGSASGLVRVRVS